MAYCRWSDGDVYVYGDVNDRKGEIRCCSCELRFLAQPVGGVFEKPYPSFIAAGPKEMIAHLKEHEAVGQRVPKYAFTRLRKEAQARAKKPIRYPIHFLVRKMENIEGEIMETGFLGPMPICGYSTHAHFRKILGTKKSEDGHAHHRDETTINPKQVTCPECKSRLKAGLTALPYKGKKKPSAQTSTTSKTK